MGVCVYNDFNPPALWGAGLLSELNSALGTISIHPPCGGRDYKSRMGVCVYNDFNPPTLWGAGPLLPLRRCSDNQFQSTRPVGGGTLRAWEVTPSPCDFNPPALWGAGQRATRIPDKIKKHFNPPALWGAGPRSHRLLRPVRLISIHPPCGGRDKGAPPRCSFLSISIHPPCGGRDLIARDLS